MEFKYTNKVHKISKKKPFITIIIIACVKSLINDLKKSANYTEQRLGG